MSRRNARTKPSPKQPTPAAPAADRWLLVLAAIFAAALAWRLSYLARLAGSPLDGSRLSDARSYWDWASYLLAHGLPGKNPYFLAPLYPHVVALLRAILGDDPHRLLAVQAGWGALSAVLVADAARRLSNRTLGAIAGAGVAFARMATFFDGLVLAESLLFFLAALLLWSVARTVKRAVTMRDALAWGALVGLLAQGRATAALLVIPACALAWQCGAAPRERTRLAGAVALAFALACAPAALRNAAVSGEWIPFTYNGGYNLYVGNNPIAEGGFCSVTGTHDITDLQVAGEDGGIEGDGRRYIAETTGRQLGATESSAWWASRALQWMSAHPARAATLAARKVAMAWSRHESPQIENVDEFELLAGPVGLPWLGTFALLAMLAMAGAFAAWKRGPQERFLVGYVVITTLALAPFFVTDRYRHHLAPAALLLAAIAADALWRARAGRGVRRMALALAPGAALGLALALWPVPYLTGARYAVSLAGDVGTRWLDRGRADLAERELSRAVGMDRQGGVRWAATSEDSFQRGVLYFNHARALTALGRNTDALASLRIAAALAPGSGTIASALASAYAASGDQARAAQLYAQEGRADGALDAERDRAWSLARAGQYAEAEKLFADIVTRAPQRYDVWGALVRLQVQSGHVPAAREWLARGKAAGWRGAGPNAHEALLLVAEGRKDDARRVLAGIPRDAAAADPGTADVLRFLEQQLGR